MISVVLSGVGGQGIVFAGRLLASAAFREGRHVTLRYTYGSEVTGTPVHSDVKISETPITSPFIEGADYVVVVHAKALRQQLGRVREGGTLIVDSGIEVPAARGVRVVKKPFVDATRVEKAGELGSYAIIAALGYLAKLGVVSIDSLVSEARLRRRAEENLRALRIGYSL